MAADLIGGPALRRADIAVGLGLVLATILIRWPFRDAVGEDEAFFLVIGRQWLHGLPPYIGAFDVKPPGTFALAALSEMLFGAQTLAIKALEMAAVAATSLAVYDFGRRFLGQTAGLTAALLYVASSLTLSGVNTATELTTSAFAAWGMLLGIAAIQARRPGRVAVVGLIFGMAATIKQPAVFEVLPLLGWLIMRRWPGGIAALVLGILAVPAATAGYFAAEGGLALLIRDTVEAAAGRMQGDDVTWLQGIARVPPMLRPALPLVLGGMFLWATRRSMRENPAYPALRLIGYWFLSALLGILAVRAMYDHYFETLMPPLCLASGFALDRLKARFGTLAQVGGLAVSVLYLGAQGIPFAAEDSTLAGERDVARSLGHAGQMPGDRILVLDRYLALYLLADAEPPTGVFHPQHLLCRFPLLPRDILSTTLATRPAFILRAATSAKLVCERPERLAELDAVLTRDYCVLAHVAVLSTEVPADIVTIYSRRDRIKSDCSAN